MVSFDEKTRVTKVVRPAEGGAEDGAGPRTDCLVVIYTKEPTLMGKRFVLDGDVVRVGRGTDNQIVLDSDAVSRRHAHFDARGAQWVVADDGSTNGTYCNDEQVRREVALRNGDRVKIGSTIFKYLSGEDVEAQYHEEIYRLTIVDGLTQIHNKRYLSEALERELIRARRHGRDLSILMFDIDHFKRINDSYGHAAGDTILHKVATILAGQVRRVDLAARYGGEEFAVVLEDTDRSGALVMGERIRAAVSALELGDMGIASPVTVSVGIASIPTDCADTDSLLVTADEALYQAKRDGRNRCVLAA